MGVGQWWWGVLWDVQVPSINTDNGAGEFKPLNPALRREEAGGKLSSRPPWCLQTQLQDGQGYKEKPLSGKKQKTDKGENEASLGLCGLA